MTKELTTTEGLHTLAGITIEQLQHYGLAFFQSGMFPDIKSAAQAEVKIQAGYELGFSPIYSMTKIYIVKGKVMVGAEALGAMVKRSGRYDYHISKLTDTECVLIFTDKNFTAPDGSHDAYISIFTIDEAKRADLMAPGGGWFKWPRAMLMSKAVSQGARAVCPEVISGVYTPEDFGYATNPETQQVEGIIEGEVVKVEKPPVQTVPTGTGTAHSEQGTALPPVAGSGQPAEAPRPVTAAIKVEGFDMDWLKEQIKVLNWDESSFRGWLVSLNMAKRGIKQTLVETIQALTTEQRAELVKKINERIALK